MLVALTGLHGAGISYFANNIQIKFGFKIYNKKEIIQYICKRETGRDDWGQWYKEEFNRDPYKITEDILSCIDLNDNVILDAVHSDLEWKIISSMVPNSEIIGVITPEFIRKQRREIGDVEKDKKRLAHWHNGGGCLLSELSWTFNGGASLELNEKIFLEFCEYLKKKELAISGKKVKFSDNKDEKIQRLMEENEMLEEKIEKAEVLIKQYNDKIKKLNQVENNVEK